MKWQRWHFAASPSVTAPISIARTVIEKMVELGHELMEPDPSSPLVWRRDTHSFVSEYYADVGGMCHIHRPRFEVTWNKLKFGAPCEDVGTVLSTLQRRQPTRISSHLFYELNMWSGTLLLLAGQRLSLIAMLKQHVDECDRLATAFYEKHDMTKLLEQANVITFKGPRYL